MAKRWNGAPKRKRVDNYPNLRKQSRLGLGRGGHSGPPSRRTRLIYKALLRADRRWDAYAARVRRFELPWEKSKNTLEWRLVLQNGRLIKGLRKAKNVEERTVRLARLRDSEAEVSEVWVHQGTSRSRSDSFVGE